MDFGKDFTKTMKVLTWRVIMIDWRLGLKNPLLKVGLTTSPSLA